MYISIICCIILFAVIIIQQIEFGNKLNKIEKENTEEIALERAKAIKQSKAVTQGQINENIIPLFEDFPYNSKEIRFSGQPTDYIVYENMEAVRVGSTEAKISIILADVKTNTSGLTHVQKAIKNAVDNNRVRFETWTIKDNKLKIK